RAHAGDRPADPEQKPPDDVAAMARLALEVERLPEERPAAPLQQPEPRRGDEDRDADDSIELEALEQEHALDHVVVAGAGTAQDEAEQRAENEVEHRHRALPLNRPRG